VFCRAIFEMLSKSRFHTNIKIVITVIVSCLGEFLHYLFKVMNYEGLKRFDLNSHRSSYKFFFSGVGLTSPGTAATSGLLYSPR
jgi:hypothetical protein